MGIAIVVPTTKILEVLDHPELKKMREVVKTQLREQS